MHCKKLLIPIITSPDGNPGPAAPYARKRQCTAVAYANGAIDGVEQGAAGFSIELLSGQPAVRVPSVFPRVRM